MENNDTRPTVVCLDGHVRDVETNEPIHRALITIKHIDSGEIYKTVTDKEGIYSCNAPRGNLYIEISHKGYITVSEYCYTPKEHGSIYIFLGDKMQKVAPEDQGSKEELLLGQSTDEKPNTKPDKKSKNQVITRNALIKRIKETVATIITFVLGIVAVFQINIHDLRIWTFWFVCLGFLISLYLIWQPILNARRRKIMLSVSGFLGLLILIVCLLWQVRVWIQRSEQSTILEIEKRVTKERQ